jgi:hypothetical protein
LPVPGLKNAEFGIRNEGFVPGYLIADSGILFLFSANLSSSVRDKSFFLSPASLEHAEFAEKEDSGSRNQDSGDRSQDSGFRNQDQWLLDKKMDMGYRIPYICQPN